MRNRDTEREGEMTDFYSESVRPFIPISLGGRVRKLSSSSSSSFQSEERPGNQQPNTSILQQGNEDD